MNYGAPLDLYGASQQQLPQQPQITPWVAQRMQNAGANDPMAPLQGQPNIMGAAQGAPAAPGAVASPNGAMPPETVRAILSLQQQSADDADAVRSKELAARLRADAKGQLAGRDTGKFYVGPSWLNLGANVLENRRANKADADQADSERKAAQRRQDANERLFRSLTEQ